MHTALALFEQFATLGRKFGWWSTAQTQQNTMITKRQLGISMILAGVLGTMLLFVLDWLGTSDFVGIGPTQRMLLLLAGSVILVGLTLLPLGDRPA
jgi:hypothetical protein